MNPAGKHRVVVPEGVGGKLAVVAHLGRDGQRLPIGLELALVQQVGSQDRGTSVEQFLDGGDRASILTVQTRLAASVDPDNRHPVVSGLAGKERYHRQRFAVWLQSQDVGKFQVVTPIVLDDLGAVDLVGTRQPATNDRLDRTTDDALVERHVLALARDQRSQLGLGLLGQKTGDGLLVRLTTGRGRVVLAPDGVFLGRQWLVIGLDNRLVQAQPQVAIEQVVHDPATDVVVVVRESDQGTTQHVVPLAVEPVELSQLGIALGHHFLGPVVGRCHALWLGSKQRGQFDIAGADSQQATILARAPTLHRCRDHPVGKRDNRTRVDGTQQDRLGSATATTGHADPLGIHIGQAGQEIQATDRIPGLQPHDALETQFRLGADEAPTPGTVHVRPLLLQPMGHPHANLLGISVALHVEDEGHATHPGQRGTTRQLGKPARLAELLAATLDQGVHRPDAVILQPTTVAMRTQNSRVFSTGRLAGRPEQQARDKVTRNTLEIHLLDGETRTGHLAENNRLHRRPLWHWPQARRDQNPLLQFPLADFPLLASRRHLEGEVAVEIFLGSQA